MSCYQLLIDCTPRQFGEVFRKEFADKWKSQGKSQEELATAIGVSRQSISLWLNEKRKPEKEDNFKKLCRVMGSDEEIYRNIKSTL